MAIPSQLLLGTVSITLTSHIHLTFVVPAR